MELCAIIPKKRRLCLLITKYLIIDFRLNNENEKTFWFNLILKLKEKYFIIIKQLKDNYAKHFKVIFLHNLFNS